MPAALPLDPQPLRPTSPPSAPIHAARLAVYDLPGRPPALTTVAADDSPELIEALYEHTVAVACVPPLALREVVENLVHADLAGVVVSVLDGGATVIVCDAGRGIGSPELAVQPGFTTADAEQRRTIRGVGAGLPTARALLDEAGGCLQIADNLGSGTAVTLRVPAVVGEDRRAGARLCDEAIAVLALLLEMDHAPLARLSDELELDRTRCGRLVAQLEQIGAVARRDDGSRTLTGSGRELVTTLFS